MPKAIEEAARVLKDGQRFVLAIVHPMYSVGNFSDTGPDAGNSFVISQSYFDKKRCARTDVYDDLIMTFHREHRPLQAYTQALTEAGFSIEQLREVTEPNPNEPRHGVPMFLDIVAVRQHRPQQTTSRHQPGSAVSGTGVHLRQHRRLGLQGRESVQIPIRQDTRRQVSSKQRQRFFQQTSKIVLGAIGSGFCSPHSLHSLQRWLSSRPT